METGKIKVIIAEVDEPTFKSIVKDLDGNEDAPDEAFEDGYWEGYEAGYNMGYAEGIMPNTRKDENK